MQYLLLVFEIVFYNPCSIMVAMYKGLVGGGRGELVRVDGQVEGGPSLTMGHRLVLCFH